MVEEMYAEEMKGPQEGGTCSNAAANNSSSNANPSGVYGGGASERLGQGRGGGDDGGGERKPTRAQLQVHDAGSLASVVSIGSGRGPQNIDFGMMDGHLDFDAYSDAHAAGPGGHHGFGGGVSLTLGLQQHAGGDPHGGVNVAFAAAQSSAAAHEFLFMAGGGEQHQQQMVADQGQFAAGMDGDGVAASHYDRHRGISAATGFQLLHDLAG